MAVAPENSDCSRGGIEMGVADEHLARTPMRNTTGVPPPAPDGWRDIG